MSSPIGIGIFRLIEQYEPDTIKADPAAVTRVVIDLAVSLAGVLTAVMMQRGEEETIEVTHLFADRVQKELENITGKTIKILQEKHNIH